MTPEDAESVEEGAQENPLSPLLKEHGVANVEELRNKIDSYRIPNKAFAELRHEAKSYKEQLEEKERELDEIRDGLGDGSGDEAAVVREIRNLRRELSDVQKEVLAKPEDEELQPFMELALQKKPWIKNLRTARERMDATRTVALGLRAETNAAERERAAHETGRRKADTVSRTYVERSGGTSFGHGGSSSEEADLKRYDEELADAGSDKAKIRKIEEKYRKKYPDWGI